ncbi:MAG: valine--tRNA ligase [Candidatus Terrybacteria bacterium]|nr:valine--tRNA ligase [Candidatus Terrybacteria bacterium]
MNEKLLKPYDPKATEDRIYKLWEDSGYFTPENLPVSKIKNLKLKIKNYCIVIPPPNVTGSLHMGHALNAVIQDILIRKKRMEGYKTLWLPGTDHAGIATQNVVEKELKKQGLSRHDLGREKFIEKVWEWKEKYGNIILDQLKKLGSSCDWSRTRFTMDADYAKAVEEAFLHYHKKRWIYQGDRVVNWCKRCQTSLSDLELEYEDTKGKLYYIKYGSLTVATTRPETMLGDTAVAVNPKDKRYKDLIGKKVLLPIMNREIPIIADRDVEMEFGTGAVKVTPAHDIFDFDLAERHKLPLIQVIDRFGKMTEEAGKDYEGLSAREAREKIVAELQNKGFLEKIDDYNLRVSKCYRCGSVIEPQISRQWFLKMSELAKMAKKAVKNGKIKFHPKRWEKVYFDWLNNIKDWCISRQIWWGHKIPLESVDDVLDTWFSSALWPFATLNKKDQKEFYPTQALSTGRDIINLWVARMIFSGLEFTKKEPFKDVIIHPTILTKEGKRMSKSLGTGIDPMVLIDKYGADATRFGLIYQTMGGQDIHWAEEHVMAGKKFCNKIWNAARFVLEQNEKSEIRPARWQGGNPKSETISKSKILKEFEKVKKSANKNIEQYKFGHALREIYDFFWHKFCDNYIEEAKKSNTAETKEILFYILSESIKLLHPFMPFITEEIWGMLLSPDVRRRGLLIIEKWPKT